MKKLEFLQLDALVTKWLKESALDINNLRKSKFPIRCTKLSIAIEVKQQCTEELVNFLKTIEVEK